MTRAVEPLLSVPAFRQMNESAQSDEQLATAFQAGDRSAFQELMVRYSRPITSYLYRRLKDRDWAEDLAQEVFLRVYRKIHTFQAQAKFSTWLYRIAHNLSIDFLKRKRLEPRLGSMGESSGEDGPVFEAVDDEPTPELALHHKEVAQRVHETVEGLGKKYRDVFLLCALQGLSYEEAAHVLDLSVKTVSSRLCRARKKFKARFEPHLETVGVVSEQDAP